MGLNDDRLTPGERDDLRGRLLAGSRRITPVGAHRRAIMASTLSVVLVAGLAVGAVTAANVLRAGENAGPASTPTPTLAPTEPPMPAPSETPTSASTGAPLVPSGPIVALDGDCVRAMSTTEAAEILGVSGTVEVRPELRGVAPSLRDSAALLGGLSCGWYADREGYDYLGVEMLPREVVPAEVLDAAQAFDCSLGSSCVRTEMLGDVWVQFEASRLRSPEQPVDDEERGILEQRLESVFERVSSQVLLAVNAPLSEAAWHIPPCADLAATVTSVGGIAGARMGFPGHSPSAGAWWDSLVYNRVVDWCSWYSEREQTSIEIVIQPDLGTPPTEQLAEVGASPIDVAGADAGFIVANPRTQTNSRVIAVSGVNRLTVSGQSGASPEVLASVASAVIAQLNG